MRLLRSTLKSILAGLLVTVAQVALAVCLLAPEGSFPNRYSTLVQHDSYWFVNILDRGYQTTVPPINHKVMEVSNVAFFPAYPVLAAMVRDGLGLQTDHALLVTAQAAAWGFWSYFFLFCDRWGFSPVFQILGAFSVLAHPAAFFLIAGYSESLFMMALLGFIYFSTSEEPRAKLWAALHGVIMSATRIVGIPCAIFPIVHSILTKGSSGVRRPLDWLRLHASAIGLAIIATFGALIFFVYCQLRWGRWDMYMLTQTAGWGIVPDYLAVFRPSSYRWLLPALNNPTEVSQMAMTLGGIVFGLIAIFEFIPALRRRTNWQIRVGFYICAAIVYYISVSGVACVGMESMLRYQFCIYPLIVLAFMHFLHQFRTPPAPVRAIGVAAVVLATAVGLGVQGWYVWNFTRGNWVA